MKLLDVYKSILKTANLVVTDDGYVSMKNGNDTLPVMVENKRLVLPTQEHLRHHSKDKVIFHPLNENALRGESKVLEKLRTALNMRTNMTLSMLGLELLVIIGSVNKHAKLTPDQSIILSRVKNVDDKTVEVFKKLIAAMPLNQTQKTICSIYLKRSGIVDGKHYKRAAIVSFPLYSDLKAATTECYGVKLRVKDREAILQLLEYMIPNIGVAEKYNRGSESDIAPYMDALMKAVMAIGSPINDIVEMFKKHIEDHEDLMFDSEWVDAFDNLGTYINEIRMIPMQLGNEGAVINKQSLETSVVAPQNTTTPVWMNQQPQQPNLPFVASPQPQPSGIAKTDRGLDFSSVMRNIPGMQQQFGMSGMNMMPMGPVGPTDRNQRPSWDQPPSAGWSQSGFQPRFGSI